IFYCMGSDELNPWFAWRIPNNFKTIAETLKENGYNTACITGNGLLNPELGYAQGFDTFLSFDNTDASCINKQVYELLDSDTFIQCPFFLYIHYYDPHKPYDPPEGRDIYKGGIIDEYDYREADLSEINKYDSEIFFIDTELEKICTYLKERELYDRSLIIITSDHGEQFHEHGDYEHGKSVYNEEIHVPLIMKLNNLRMKISHNVSLLDIYPTILDVLGLAIPHPIQGKSLIKSANKKGRRVILTEVARDVLKKAVIVDDAKLIVGFDETQFLITNKTQEKCLKIFNFKRDRWEKNPLEDKHLEKKLRSDFYDLYNQYSAFNEPCIAPDNQPSEEILNKLKSLAYLN
ncbi:MAG: sulfatase, partial [Candidatus Omnitrophica bacterium]|nr:sulfatase [Candidatus Omnitrophota bacterium]